MEDALSYTELMYRLLNIKVKPSLGFTQLHRGVLHAEMVP